MYFSTKLCFLQVIFYASEYLTEEMVADLVGFTLSEPAILEKLTGQQRNILQKFVDKLVSMFSKADAKAKEEYFASRFGGDIRAIFKDVAREADSIAEQFKAALDTSQKAEKNTVERDGVRYSKDLSFKEQVDAVVGGKDTTSTHLKISEHTPKFLIDLGLNDKPMLITSAHTKTALGIPVKNKNVHAVEKNTMYNLLSLMENPVIAIESTNPGSIVLFINAVDANKAPVLCSIKIDGQGFYNSVEVKSNVVTSVYGKDTNPVGFIENAVNDNRLLYWDKEKSQKLFAIPGLQLPNNINSFDSNIIIRKVKQNVNRNSKELFPDDRTMSAEEIERDEIEQYIQQIKSSDDLSDADVQAIREEITQSRKQQREQLLAEIATTNLARWGAELGK